MTAPIQSRTKAKAEADLVEAKKDKEAVMLELEQLANYKAELHSSCDFVIGVVFSLMDGSSQEVFYDQFT